VQLPDKRVAFAEKGTSHAAFAFNSPGAVKVSQPLRRLDGTPALKKLPEELKHFLEEADGLKLMNTNILSASCTLTPFPT
jgi:hypothetical protein